MAIPHLYPILLYIGSNIGGSKVAVFHTQCSPVLELFPG